MRPVAVFYATREGHTKRVAEEVVLALRQHGFQAQALDVRSGQAAVVLANYGAAILAASVHAGRHEPEMITFVKAQREALQSMPNAFLSVTLSEAGVERKTASNEQRARALRDVREMAKRFIAETGWRPDRVVPVAGALSYTKYNVFARFVMKRIAKKAGGSADTSRDHDHTDWPALDRFVATFAHELGATSSLTKPAPR